MTHLAGLKLDVDKNLFDVYVRLPTLSPYRDRLQVTGKVVLHPLVPWQPLPFLSFFLTEGAHFRPELVHLMVLLRVKLVQAYKDKTQIQTDA